MSGGRPEIAGSPEATAESPERGFRPMSRRRARIAAGVVVAAVALGGNVLLYTALGDKTEVVQMVNTVRAGDVIGSADVRVVEVDLDPTVPYIDGDAIGGVINQYARTYIPAGTLAIPLLMQPSPLVNPGAGVVSIEITPTRVPSGLVERSRVRLVLVVDDVVVQTVDGRVVRRGIGDGTDSIQSMSVEVVEADAPAVAASNDVRVVLLDGDIDPATERQTVEGGG